MDCALIAAQAGRLDRVGWDADGTGELGGRWRCHFNTQRSAPFSFRTSLDVLVPFGVVPFGEVPFGEVPFGHVIVGTDEAQ